MEFDHIRGTKFMALSAMAHETYSEKLILREIDKCELVCVLCHKDRTYKRLQATKKPDSYPCYTRNRKLIQGAKSVPCVICHKSYASWQMEYDHHKGSKTQSVGKLIGASARVLLAEIAKCQVLCALCHRRKTKADLWD